MKLTFGFVVGTVGTLLWIDGAVATCGIPGSPCWNFWQQPQVSAPAYSEDFDCSRIKKSASVIGAQSIHHLLGSNQQKVGVLTEGCLSTVTAVNSSQTLGEWRGAQTTQNEFLRTYYSVGQVKDMLYQNCVNRNAALKKCAHVDLTESVTQNVADLQPQTESPSPAQPAASSSDTPVKYAFEQGLVSLREMPTEEIVNEQAPCDQYWKVKRTSIWNVYHGASSQAHGCMKRVLEAEGISKYYEDATASFYTWAVTAKCDPRDSAERREMFSRMQHVSLAFQGCLGKVDPHLVLRAFDDDSKHDPDESTLSTRIVDFVKATYLASYKGQDATYFPGQPYQGPAGPAAGKEQYVLDVNNAVQRFASYQVSECRTAMESNSKGSNPHLFDTSSALEEFFTSHPQIRRNDYLSNIEVRSSICAGLYPPHYRLVAEAADGSATYNLLEARKIQLVSRPALPLTCTGDVNHDGVVDPMDNGFITARLGCNPAQGAAACTDADANKDGKVDPLDSGFVTARYGSCGNTTAETTGSEAATSEPASSPSNPVALIVPNASGLQSYERTILTDGSGQKYVMLTTLFGQSYRADVKEQSGEWCVNMANWGGQRYWKCTGIGEKY